MEKRRRNKKVVDSVSLADAPKPSSAITFDAFFAKCVRESKLKSWQYREIAVFFKDLNLKEKEDLEVYEETLKKY